MAIALTDGVIEMDVSGTPTDITDGMIGGQLEITGTVGEYFTLDDLWAKTTDGGIRGAGQLECLVEASATSTHGRLRAWLLARGAKEFTFSIPDKATGSLEIVADMRIESLSPLFQLTAGDGNPQKSTARIKSDGAMAIAVIA